MNKMDQQDVLKAIFNVKKYAKNLKVNRFIKIRKMQVQCRN